MATLVEVRPLEKVSGGWAPTQDQSFKRPVTVSAPLVGGRYQVDIDEARLEELGKTLGLDLSTNSSYDKPHPVYDGAPGKVKLENNTMFFDLEVLLQELQLGILRASAIVANSQTEYDNDQWPDAEFVIVDRVAEIEKKGQQADKKFQASEFVLNMDQDTKVALITILTGEDVSNQTQKYVSGILQDLIDKQLDRVLKFAKMELQELQARASFRRAVDTQIIKEVEGHLFFGDIDLGIGEADAFSFIQNPKNFKVRDSINDLVERAVTG